tara:strand:+ start:96 stop:473 length:378 start_codon:yes stop_codon:yes gene_type:complete
MAKRRLTEIAKDYDISFEELQDIAFNKLTEESISGKGRNTWIDEIGQDILDDNIPIKEVKPRIYRGRVRNLAPNPRFAFVHIKEKNGCVKVEISKRMIGSIRKLQMINVEEVEDDVYVMPRPRVV